MIFKQINSTIWWVLNKYYSFMFRPCLGVIATKRYSTLLFMAGKTYPSAEDSQSTLNSANRVDVYNFFFTAYQPFSGHLKQNQVDLMIFCCLISRVFTNGPRYRGSIPGRVIPNAQKRLLDAALLSTQHYKVRIKGKLEQCWEWCSALPYT